jgi:hypothetical protein
MIWSGLLPLCWGKLRHNQLIPNVSRETFYLKEGIFKFPENLFSEQTPMPPPAAAAPTKG